MRTRARTVATTLVVLAGFVGSSAISTAAQASGGPGDPDRRVDNVIYLLGDGMGRTHVTAARERYFGGDGKLAMETMPVVGQVSTHSVERGSGQPGQADFAPNFAPNYVTDSASAATAWSSGLKTYNAALGVDARGRVVPTVMELAKDAGYRTGNVSTA